MEVSSPLCESAVLLDACGVDSIASLLYWHGLDGWEPETVPVFLQLVTADATVIDVGSNNGLFSLLAARRAPQATVHAIEPVPRVHELLTANVALNRLTNITCHRLALSDCEGSVSLYVPKQRLPMMASMVPGWQDDSDRIQVDSLTLDQFVARQELTHLDVVKIDAEGSENLVLRGARNTLATFQPFVVCEVLVAGDTAGDLTSLLDAAGYIFFILAEDGPQLTTDLLGNAPEGCRNYLFVPESRAQEAQALLGVKW